MKAVTGVFRSKQDAQTALTAMRSAGAHDDHITLLTPENMELAEQSVPAAASEQPGMGKAIGAVVGGAVAFSGGPLLVAALVPGVGPITALGLLGGAVLAAAGASVGAVAGGKLED